MNQRLGTMVSGQEGLKDLESFIHRVGFAVGGALGKIPVSSLGDGAP